MANLFYGKLTQIFAKIYSYTGTCLDRSWTGLGPQTGPIKTDFAVLAGPVLGPAKIWVFVDQSGPGPGPQESKDRTGPDLQTLMSIINSRHRF